MCKNHEAMTQELSAAWGEICDAVTTILDAAERIQSVASTFDVNSKLSVAVAEIFEACAFQDIAGQRIAKVAGALSSDKYQLVENDHAPAARSDSHLLNGPQLPGRALPQDAIDDLFASLGEPSMIVSNHG